MEIPTWTIQNWQCFLNPSALHLVLERDGGHGAHLLWRRENTTALHSNSTRNILDMRAGISTLKNTSSRVHSMSLAIWNTESGKECYTHQDKFHPIFTKVLANISIPGNHLRDASKSCKSFMPNQWSKMPDFSYLHKHMVSQSFNKVWKVAAKDPSVRTLMPSVQGNTAPRQLKSEHA